MAKKSLVSETAISVPAVGGDLAVLPSLQGGAPYLVFLHPKSGSYPRILGALPDAQEGDPVIVFPEPEPPVAVSPLKFFVARLFSHYSDISADGVILRSTSDLEKAQADKSLKEHIEALLLVFAGDGLVPVTARFNSGKVPGIKPAVAAAAEAATEAWGKKSPDHKASLAIPKAHLRFTISTRSTFKTSRDKGFRYLLLAGIVKPTTAGDAQSLADLMNDESGRKLCATVNAEFDRKVASICEVQKK